MKQKAPMVDRMVFVLGAGFTRAFVPKSPLLVDDYEIPLLRKRFESFPHVTKILDDALAEYSDGRVDLERLMTRLSGMPYDGADANREFAVLDTILRKSLVERLSVAKAGEVAWDALGKFARFVLENEASVVTFNYDDVLDEALWKATQADTVGLPAWHPDGGYGFHCRPSSVCVADTERFMDPTRSLVLKLHGSVNWRSRLGEGTPRGPAGILHHEDWFSERVPYKPTADRIESHWELDSFIVPPVLVKAELAVHPVLNVVWKLAHERLTASSKVVFIGYSLPATDLASRILFRETLSNRDDLEVQIVTLAHDAPQKDIVKYAYRTLFKSLPDNQFEFSGAKAWIERLIEGRPGN
jgi:hypothetical protein